MNTKLKFAPANAKLVAIQTMVGKVYSFSLLSGHTCPWAKDCLSKAVEGPDGKRRIVDGPHTVFRCFSASQEALFTAVYNSRKYNTDAIKACGNDVGKMKGLILKSIPAKAKAIRVHVAGDFFTLNYMKAWLEVAGTRPDIRFWAYTKALPLWVKVRHLVPHNFILTASYGGKADELIAEKELRFSKVVYSQEEAAELGLEIDHDDSHAATNGPSFALLIHGTQPAGTDAAKAVSKLNGVGSYSRKKAGKLE